MANQVQYGFLNLTHVFSERVTTVGIDTVYTAIQETVAEHQRQMNALLDLFVETTTDFKGRFKTPTAARLQPLDENGRARPILPAGVYDLAWPIQKAGAAWGVTREAEIKMTVQDANAITAAMLSADFRWMRDHILAALFYDAGGDGTGWTFTDPQWGSLNILGLADGDTQTYNVFSGSENGATDDHILATADAIADATNPFPAIYTELTEHPENGGQVVAIMPTNLISAVKGLATFYPAADPNLRAGVGVTELTGTLGTAIPGELVGYADQVWITEWRSLPSNYAIFVTTEGERPLRMRQHPEAELQGFRFVAERNDHPFREAHWERHAGFGAWNRVGAVVMRFGNGSWAVPTGYTSPMP